MSSKCPVCATENDTDAPRRCGEAEFHSCQRCGPFFLEFRSSDLSRLLTKEKEGTRFPRDLTDDIEKIAALSHWIRTWYESRRREPTLDWELVKSIIRNPRPSLAEQADSFVRWLGDSSQAGGDRVRHNMLTLEAIVGSATSGEFLFVFNHLKAQGIADGERELDKHSPTGFTQIAATLSFSGWERYRELKRSTSESHKAFMAMEYGQPDLDNVFKDVLKPAVEQTGFDLFILPERPKAGLIDNTLRVEIRTSSFLIADLTHDNAGAYWEAGYAEGLSKPVIYTCEEKKFDELKTHFDTNHHLTIKWDAKDTDKLKHTAEELKATIRATLPGEAKLTDD